MQEDIKSQEKKFLEFTRDEEAIHVNFLRDGIQVADILLGITATIRIVMDKTGKDQLEIFKVISEMLDEAENQKNKEKGENKNGSK